MPLPHSPWRLYLKTREAFKAAAHPDIFNVPQGPAAVLDDVDDHCCARSRGCGDSHSALQVGLIEKSRQNDYLCADFDPMVEVRHVTVRYPNATRRNRGPDRILLV